MNSVSLMNAEWRDDLLAACLAIEVQHKRIMQSINCFASRIELEQCNIASLITALDNLDSLIKHHFVQEERIMMLTRYPLAMEHEKHHRSFNLELVFQNDKARIHGEDVSLDIIAFLNRWLDNHEQTHDQTLKAFLVQHLNYETRSHEKKGSLNLFLLRLS